MCKLAIMLNGTTVRSTGKVTQMSTFVKLGKVERRLLVKSTMTLPAYQVKGGKMRVTLRGTQVGLVRPKNKNNSINKYE